MTPDNRLSHLFPGQPRQSRAPAADLPASVELRPVLQRRIAAHASYLPEVNDEPLDQKQVEPERETKGALLAHQSPVDPPVNNDKTERIIERVLVEPKTEPPRRAATDERSDPALKPDWSAGARETESSRPEPPRLADSQPQKTPSVRVAPNSQPRDESPPAPGLSGEPAPVQFRQEPRTEKSPDREPPRVAQSQPESQEPERKPVVVEPVIRAEFLRAQEPPPATEKSDAFPRMKKAEPADRTVSDKVAAAPKEERQGEPKIEPAATRAEPEPVAPLAAQPAATRTEPVLTPVAQPQANADSQSNRQPSPGGVTLRIGSIQITSRGKSAQKPPATRRPARSHKIEPRLPFASGRW